MGKRRLFARRDWLILGAVLLAAAAAMLLMRSGPRGVRAVVEVEGETVAARELADLKEPELLEISGYGGVELQVELSAQGARVVSSTCPDKTCVRTGILRHGGESAICLPGRTVLRLESGDGRDSVDAETY